MAIDSIISLVDFKVLGCEFGFLYFTIFQQIFSEGICLSSLQFMFLRAISAGVLCLCVKVSSPVGQEELPQALQNEGQVFLKAEFFFLHSKHSLVSTNLVKYSICSSSFLMCCCNCIFCYLRLAFYCNLGSTFLTGMLLIQEAILAQVRVWRDYSKCAIVGLRQAIIRQYELPPIDCFRREVSLLSLQGGRLDFPVVVVQQSEAMTCLRVNKLLFISIPYLNTTPVDLVTFCLSLPAKSTIYNLLSICQEGSQRRQLCTRKVSRQCDRLEVLFILCEPIILFLRPLFHHFKAYSADLHCPQNIFQTVNC